jgi:small subunit ribosomal protein S7
MSRKKQAPKRIFYPDSKYNSLTLAKFINFLMYDGKKTTSEKIIYDALDGFWKLQEKEKIKQCLTNYLMN